MAKADNKTKETEASVSDFIGRVADEAQKADALAIAAMMERVSGHPPRMWGPSIIGFGAYSYRYDSGREGESCRIGFSPRKGQTVLYLGSDFAGRDDMLARLGKHKTGKACLYIKRLSDIDTSVLEAMTKASLDALAEKYPDS